MKDHDYITCRQLIDFIADYLEGSLPAPMRHEFERHLKVCPSCVSYLESYKETIRLGKVAMVATDDPAPVPESLVKAIRAARLRGGQPSEDRSRERPMGTTPSRNFQTP